MSTDSIDWLRQFIDSAPPDLGGTSSEPGEGRPRRFGRFEVVSEIGRGGTSVVYKATDPDLKRTVALKVLRDAGHPVLIERLHREATTAAKLKHPNIVAIHEVGTILGAQGGVVHFIAMDYVEGANLAEAAAQWPSKDRLEVLAAVARTTAFAHEQGVVHRDLKPENVLVESATRVEPSGLRWHVWLTDFGLAKVIGGEDLTRSGTVLGTPHYMSPEQVRGRSRETGPATDVWALGVMLYEILTGHRPFEGETALEIYEQIVHQDPKAPRKWNPAIAEDLDTLTLKALEKDPSARYPDARAFSEDLDRCLRDEPISTRPAGIARKSWRSVRRNPIPYLLGAGMASVFVVAVLLALTGRAERQESVLAFRNQARLALEAALALRRAGANSKMREFLPPLEDAYRKASSRAPDLAEADYLIGRMHRALIEDEKALEYQEAALRKDPSYAPALYERAVLNFRKSAESGAPPGDEGDRPKTEAERLTESILRDCSTVLDRPQKELDEAQILVTRGILASCRGQAVEARALLEHAAQIDPLLDEVWQILGHLARVGTASSIDERERQFRAEEETYTQGLLRDKGYIPYLVRRGHLHVARGHYRAEHGRNPTPDFDLAELDLTQAIEKDPASIDAPMGRARGRFYRGVYKSPPGSDPREDYRLAETDLVELTRRPPHARSAEAWVLLGNLRFYRGKYLGEHGHDPLADFKGGTAALEKAIELSRSDQMFADAHAQLGQGVSGWAAWAWRTGQDPTSLYKEADQHFSLAFKYVPNNPFAKRWRATGIVSRAQYREARSEDPLPDYSLAEDDLCQAIRGQKDMTSAWKERAQLHFFRASVWEKAGQKERARQDFAAAAQDYLEALSLNPLLDSELGPRMKEAQKKAAELGQ
ncbi:MAG TPA: protein kinase [Planctomycetota bacterium]|nr:protein kinase [Planctomycetota bacterium]